MALTGFVFQLFFYWLLVALAALDAEHLWLPDWLTWPGILLGYVIFNVQVDLDESALKIGMGPFYAAASRLLEIITAAAIILVIRWIYRLVRRREGIGLGDAKLMALLAAWLGLPGALLAFGLGVVIGALVAVVLLLVPSAKSDSNEWSLRKLPLGTFLCIGGIVSSLWGEPIIAAYLRWAGL